MDLDTSILPDPMAGVSSSDPIADADRDGADEDGRVDEQRRNPRMGGGEAALKVPRR